jgi:hypothetical protein
MVRSGAARTVARFVVFVTLFGVSSSFAEPAGGTLVYRVLPIPIPPAWTDVVVTDINNSGEIVGYGFNGSLIQSFVATAGGFAPVPLPNASFASGFGQAINNNGQVVGWGPYTPAFARTIPFTQVFIGGTGSTTEGDPVAGLYNFASDINDSGQIAGSVFLNTSPLLRVFQAYIGDSSGRRFVVGPRPTSVSDPWLDTLARSINNLGQIAGVGRYTPVGGNQVFIGDLTGISPVNVPSGWSPVLPQFDDTARDVQINDQGQIVAPVTANDGSGVVRVALLTTNGASLIPAPPGFLSVNRPALNNAGQVVGYLVGVQGGWIWNPKNGTHLLQDLVPAEWTILSADGINDQGQIVAQARNAMGYAGPVILDPVDTKAPAAPNRARRPVLFAGEWSRSQQ